MVAETSCTQGCWLRGMSGFSRHDGNGEQISEKLRTIQRCLVKGEYEFAEKLAAELTVSESEIAVAWKALALSQIKQDKLQLAVQTLQYAVSKIDDPDLLLQLANLQTELGELACADNSYKKGLSRHPDNLDVLYGYSRLLKLRQQWGPAERMLRYVLKHQPDHSVAATSLGNMLKQLGRLDEAEGFLRVAARHRPDEPLYQFNLANLLTRRTQLAEAEQCFRHALRFAPDFFEAMVNLAILLNDVGRPAEAERFCVDSLGLRQDAVAFGALAVALYKQGRLSEATTAAKQALALQPANLDAHSNLLFMVNSGEDSSQQECLDLAIEFGRKVSVPEAHRYRQWRPGPDKRLRVGLVSGDLGQHPVGYFLQDVLPWLSKFDIELFAYPTRELSGAVADRIRSACAAWNPVETLSDAEAAERIHLDGIEVLLDLAGHTAHNRLKIFAYRPAPVQASWLGYFATTGMQEMDYLIADPWTLPSDLESSFVERILRLPDTRLCYSPPRIEKAPAKAPFEACGRVTFGNCGNMNKFSGEVMTVWACILKSVPDSRLLMQSRQFADRLLLDRVISQFRKLGIDERRLILEGPAPWQQYLDTYNRIDIVLDTFPYPGGVTLAEALWMGVPAITMKGTRFLSRQGFGILKNVGLDGWVAEGKEDYINKAVAFASDMQRLAQLRNGFRERLLRSPFCDAKRCAMSFSAILHEVRHRHG